MHRNFNKILNLLIMRNSVTDEAKNKFLIENKEAADGDGD
jgi:hypothetical protein